MSMVFCRGCGKEIHETAPTCPHCGALQGNKIQASKDSDIPDGVKGWSWGAFLLSFIWAIGNKTWIGLLALVPYVGFIMAIVLGFKGREWAWKNKQWESVEQFNRVQKKWSYWGVVIVCGMFVIGIIAAIAIPSYDSYSERAKLVEQSKVENSSQEMAKVSEGQYSAQAPIAQPPIQAQQQGNVGPSFDCSKASTNIEKQICSSPDLAKLDLQLSENYKHMLASDIGDGARADLKSTQKAWVSVRNKCTDIQCIIDQYKKRSNDVCGNYPVITGMFPECTTYE